MTTRLKLLVKRCLFALYIFLHRRLHQWNVLPYGNLFGAGRGTAVGRYYVERFLRQHAELVTGRCLEFGDPRYRDFFPRADQYQVISLAPGEKVDFVCDIHELRDIPRAAFDAVICTQVFEHLAYPERAAASIFQLLKPGGLLLLTAPFINPVHYVPTDYRRFTPECLDLILREAGFDVELVDFGGNSLVSTGSLLGMVVEDFTAEELEAQDPIFPYNVLVRARRPVG